MRIELVNEQDEPLHAQDLTHLAAVVLRGEGLPDNAEVAISLVDAGRIAALNETHLGKTGPTDVLSFPLENLEPGAPPVAGAMGPPLALGDVMIAVSVVRERAAASGVPFQDEMALMVVHGLLHLLGYDHVVDEDAEHMEACERRYLTEVGRSRP